MPMSSAKVLCTALCSLFLCCFLIPSYAQKVKGEEKLFSKAKKGFELGPDVALPIYVKLYEKNPNNAYYAYMAGVCYFSAQGDKLKSIPYLETAAKANVDSLSDANFYLAQAYHLASRFDNAVSSYKKYEQLLKDGNKITPEATQDLRRRIAMCNYGKMMVNYPVKASIINAGENVNSSYPDYGLFISPDEATAFFTTRRSGSTGGMDENLEFDEEVFSAKIVKSKDAKGKEQLSFEKGKTMGTNINSKDHDAIIGLSPDGQLMYVYRNEQLLTSNLKGFEWSKAEELNISIASEGYVPSLSLSPDAKVIYFSSDRSGGYGGLDLYKSELLSTGEWGPAVNLGPSVNTSFDEDAPFIANDERSLYFSTKGHSGMGGYDIYKTVISEGVWSTPQNMGYPINSPGDDTYFVTTQKGNLGFFSSSREGKDMDIYMIRFEDGYSPLSSLEGFIVSGDSLNNIPQATVAVISGEKQKEVYAATADSVGKFKLLIPAGKHIILNVAANGFREAIDDEVNIPLQGNISAISKEIRIKPVIAGTEQIGQKIVVHTVYTDKTFSPEISRDYSAAMLRDESVGNPAEVYAKVLERNNVYDKLRSDAVHYSEKSKTVYYYTPDSLAALLHITIDSAYALLGLEKTAVVTTSSNDVKEAVKENNVAEGKHAEWVIYFDLNKADLSGDARSKLNKLARHLKKNPEYKIEIGGHADKSGREEFNQKISEMRANEVAKYLSEKGIAKNRIRTKAYGATQPISSNEEKEGRKKNRRTEIKVLN